MIFFKLNNCTKLSIFFPAPAILLMTQELENHMLLKNMNNIHIEPVIHNILTCIRNNIGPHIIINDYRPIKHTFIT